MVLNMGMNALYAAALEVSEFMTEREWRFCIIGGLAVVRWGEPRTTADVDMTLLTGFGREEDFAKPLLDKFQGRTSNALEFALEQRVLLVEASNGRDIDISFGAFPFEEEMVSRATAFEFDEGVSLVTCSAEDLFVLKVFAGRPQDWADAESVAIRQPLDRKYVLGHLGPLTELKEAPEDLERAEKLLEAGDG